MTSDSESRVTHSRRSLQRSIVLFACCLALVAALRAQEEPPAEAAAPAETASPAETAAPAAPAEPQEAVAPKDPAPKPSSSPSPSRFEPTEKVRADFDVSFPVDI